MTAPPDPESEKGRLCKGSPEVVEKSDHRHHYTFPPDFAICFLGLWPLVLVVLLLICGRFL
jgi:hypothetical protein